MSAPIDIEMRAIGPTVIDFDAVSEEEAINIEVKSGGSGSGGGTGLPPGGLAGDILTKTTAANYAAMWVTPASSAEKDNTRPITAAAVYTEIGNINALLATI